jgi:MFS superfamily sulfate permease-like transporter
MFKQIKSDAPASLIVFLVAMPLCLGIAMASGAPLFSGLIAGIVGGIVVGSLSGSPLGVSGPAAGLAVIVLSAISTLGSFEIFLVAVVICGVFQMIMGFLRAGVVAYYFPSAVINGMLAGIGIIIFLKQIPHSVGYDADYEGDLDFFQADGQNTFSELYHMLDFTSTGPTLIALTSLLILILWEMKFMKKIKIFQLIQGPLVAVAAGILMAILFRTSSDLALTSEQLVNIPLKDGGFGDLIANLRFPDFANAWKNPKVYTIGFVMALVGSIETLLCVEASDKQDPEKRVTPTNRELKAQGVGNIVSGLIGGLPITQVIVRSSVNAQAGGKTKLSAILHGFIILFSLVLVPGLLNMIPLATLAAILFVVGYKLAKPALFKKTFKLGMHHFVPFMLTIVGVVFTDLLTGIAVGFASSLIFILYQNIRIPIVVNLEKLKEDHFYIELSENVSFFKRASLLNFFASVPDGKKVTIDASKTHYIHQDVVDVIEDFLISAKKREITVELIELYDHKGQTPLIHYNFNEKKQLL